MRLELREPDAPVWKLGPVWAAFAWRTIQERALWWALAAGLVVLALAYQSPRTLFVNIGGGYDNGIVEGFNAAEEGTGADLRWSTPDSALRLPGLGKPFGPVTVYLQLSSGRGPGAAPVAVAVTANGHPLPPLRLTPVSAAYPVTVDPAWIGPDGDLRLSFHTPGYNVPGDRRALGFQADFARIEFPGGVVLPSLTQLAGLLLAAVLLYALLRSMWLGDRAAGRVVLAFLVAGAGIIGLQRLLLTIFTWRLVAALLLALVVAFLAELGVRRLVRAAGWRADRALPEWTWTGLRGLIAVSAALKLAGLLYPNAFIFDAEFHLKYITYMKEVLEGGRSWEQYFGKNLALSVMPKEEWGAARAFIPYSPYFYLAAAPLAWLPWPLTLTVPVAGAIFEALKVALVFLAGLALGPAGWTSAARGRLAFTAAAVYALIPATFLLQQWGNWPTQLSLWLVAAWVAVTCLFWQRLTHPVVWVVSTAVLTLVMLSYTVTAVYTGIFVGLAVLVGWLRTPAERRRWTAVAGALVAASLLSVLIYYGQYVGLMIEQTLPTFGSAMQEQGALTTLRPTFGQFLAGTLGAAMTSYNLILIYSLGAAGALLVFFGRGRRTAAWQHVWLGAWLATFPLFALADFWVDQALKEFWYALPAIAVVGALWLLRVLDRGPAPLLGRAMVGLIALTLTWQSLSLWVFRLLFHNR
jgi:hypothetical protein